MMAKKVHVIYLSFQLTPSPKKQKYLTHKITFKAILVRKKFGVEKFELLI